MSKPQRKERMWSGACANRDATDSNMARDSFATFIPLSVDSDARARIIFDFFELLAAIAAHGKSNGLGGRKLSRLAGWWAFEHNGTENGFDGGYKGWTAYVLPTARELGLIANSYIVPQMRQAISSSHTSDRCLQSPHMASTASTPCHAPYRSSLLRPNTHRRHHH